MGWKIIDMPFGEVPVTLLRMHGVDPSNSGVTVILEAKASTPCGTLAHPKGEEIFIAKAKFCSMARRINIISGSRIIVK